MESPSPDTSNGDPVATPPSDASPVARWKPTVPLSWDPANPPPRKRSRRWIALGVVVVAIALVATAGWAYRAPAPVVGCGSPPAKNTRATILVLANCGSTVAMSADSFQAYQLSLYSDHMSLSGKFVADSAVGTYVVNNSVMAILDSNPHQTAPPPAYYWTCGTVTNCSVAMPLPGSPIQYYLVLENLHAQSLSVRWTEALQLSLANA